jgi:hypothetical protein
MQNIALSICGLWNQMRAFWKALVRKPHAKQNERRAITIQPGARGSSLRPLKIKNEVL